MSNSLGPDQAGQFVGPDLGPNCLPRLSADDTGKQRVNSVCSMSLCFCFEVLIKLNPIQVNIIGRGPS